MSSPLVYITTRVFLLRIRIEKACSIRHYTISTRNIGTEWLRTRLTWLNNRFSFYNRTLGIIIFFGNLNYIDILKNIKCIVQLTVSKFMTYILSLLGGIPCCCTKSERDQVSMSSISKGTPEESARQKLSRDSFSSGKNFSVPF